MKDDVYERFDLATLEDQLESLLAGDPVGEYDGNEYGPEEVTLFFYGPDAKKLYSRIRPVLLAYPLCKGARVELRFGDEGAAIEKVPLEDQ